MQRAIDRAAQARTTLILPAGTYRVAELRLPPHARIAGTRGATRLSLAHARSLFVGERAENIDLFGLVIDGLKAKPAEGRALVHIVDAQDIRLTDCTIVNAGRNAISLERCSGAVTGCIIEDAGDGALFAIDSTGLRIAGNVIRRSGNNGIQVWRSAFGNDGTIVDNRIEDTRADAGGDGPYGNGISVYRAGNVIVRGNRIDGCAFSAVRGNSASNIQIAGNVCTRLGEVAIYSEFSFEGAVITGNTVDGATLGISVTNFDVGGRLAVVQGNLVRNITAGVSEDRGAGIAIAADSVVTGNVIENTAVSGIAAGYGPYLRDVIVSDNVMRGTDIGVAVSVVPGSGSALIANNLIADAKGGAVVGLEWEKRVTGDMTKDGVGKHAHVTLSGNRVR